MHGRGIGRMLAAVGLAIASVGVSAQQAPATGPYVGVAAGNAHHDFGGTDGALALFGGYRFGRFFAVEGRYADLGSGTRTQVIDNCAGIECLVASTETIHERRSADRVSIGLSGIVPIGARFEAFARVGYGRMQYGHQVTITGDLVPGSGIARDAGSQHANAAEFALGARFNATAAWAVRLEAERIADAGGEQPITTGWIGMEYRFGGG